MVKNRVAAALGIFQPTPDSRPGNCAQAIFESFEIDREARPADGREYRKLAKGRAPGGVCGAYYAGVAVLQRSRPELIEEFEARFRSRTGCTGCRAIRRARHAECRDCVLATAEFLDQALQSDN